MKIPRPRSRSCAKRSRWFPSTERRKAEPYFREAAEGQEKVLGEDDPYTLGSLLGLARSLRAQGKYGEAETHFRRHLEGLRRTLGPDHALTIQATSELARLQLKARRESP
ncbi:MAG: tetratricopeptide repeat protein [Planctomycetota bacterium]